MSSQEQDWQGRPALPPELIIHIASYASPESLVKLELLSKAGHQLITSFNDVLWKQLVLSICTASYSSSISLPAFVGMMKDRCLENKYWDGVPSWKIAFRQLQALQASWSTSKTPKTRLDIIGFTRIDPARSALPQPKLRSLTSSRLLNVPFASQDSSYVWRARLDTARDANFVITTWHTGGVKVVDASSDGKGSILWELPRWSVRPYAHLEYRNGTACWDGESGIEVWKRWKLVLGEVGQDEPPNKRGQFVKVATLPDVPNTRGFMLNDDLHLTICSSDGSSYVYDLRPKAPVLLYHYEIPEGAAGHLEHDSDIAIYSLAREGYAVYHKESGKLLGNLDFSQQNGILLRTLQDSKETNFFKIDSEERYQQLASNDDSGSSPPRKDFVTIELEGGSLDQESNVIEILPDEQDVNGDGEKAKRTNRISLKDDSWGAAMLCKLQDGATLLVARSRGGRVLVCTNLVGLLSSLEEGSEEEASLLIRQSVAIIECGGRASRTEFLTGGWLALQGGRAAWEIDDLVYIMPMPQRQNSLPKVGTCLWMIPSFYNDELPIPRLNIP
jgi:hypothetical protein